MNWTESVRHVMSLEPVRIDIEAPPSEVHSLLTGNAFHHLPVMQGQTLVGVVSVLDLARVSLGAWVSDPQTATAWLDSQFKLKDLMTWEPEFIRDTDTLRVAADKLSTGSFHSLPVLDDADRLVGILTSTDLIRFLATAP